MNIKENLLKQDIIEEQYFEEFFSTYGHISKLSTLKLLAADFSKRKQKEKNFNIYKLKKHIKIKYPNIENLITKDELIIFAKKRKSKENVNYNIIEEEIFNKDTLKDLLKLITDKMFNTFSFSKYYKNEELYKTIKYSLDNKSLTEINQLIPLKLDLIEKENPNFKKKYQEKQILLNKIVSPESIESYYPLAREKKRVVHAFLGPTNSGKTHNAIQKLKEAKSGIYLAPLRLLAREIYDDLISSGIKVSLITGEERIIEEDATHICSTIEMLDINEEYEIAIIDEIQFLADKDRGNAWSRALIGLNSNEIMVVGSTDSKYLIDSLCKKCNDKVIYYEHNRLSPLNLEKEHIKIADLKKGDAIIGFSRKSIHNITRILEVKHNKKVSLIYGALPPEVRLEESRRFNSGETDILVSTDAIGYGLNLNINRIIFSTISKFDGTEQGFISQTVFNQISGRAGRFGKTKEGYVAYTPDFNNYDEEKTFLKLSEKLYDELPSLNKSYYFPEWSALKELSEETKNKESMYNLLISYLQIFENKNEILDFKFDFLEKTIEYLDEIKDMDIEIKYKLMFAPVRENNMYFYERCVEAVFTEEPYYNKLNIHLQKAKSLDDLEEITHNALLYMWMHQRFPECFPDYEAVSDIYKEVSIMIMEILKEGY